ncbi:histidinol-phosphatase [Brachyspira hampsonii]|uniref:Histidinol-phosphatase n=1 Tax=Brachyspira hampsonii 30446 TaxID=1289135 RepID=A0A2U4F6P5_9SPIR|nr:histidinol-phosphatase [Brachyspira hampsonii]EKV56780.1 histidinol-phosphatase [Brachyspira hampsonii 30446]MBW5389900.1 histidinol-phosphatase HisJ family protein [Brachyspira hampsonii]MBW5395169.1 histidinol-phosphatase HisJ family protein [Brachyspira hampsonii]OEJ14218.1 histidinol-phosphatase [Brachyspira hampsonii]
MKYISNLHTHTIYCDGKNTVEENIRYAIDKELISLGFSGHSHFYIDDTSMSEENTIKYLNNIKKAKEIYKDKIQIYLGIEGDYYSNLNKDTDKEMGLDYRIGSVHYIDDSHNSYFPIDMSRETFNETINHFGNIKEVIFRYYDNVIKMIENQKPDIIGHLDLVKKYNLNKEYFTEEEDWYIEKTDEVIDAIEKSKSIVEINTKLMNKNNLNAHYPNKRIIKKLLEKNIPITINSDAHQCNNIDNFYFETADELNKLGVKFIKMLIDNEFKDIYISKLGTNI